MNSTPPVLAATPAGKIAEEVITHLVGLVGATESGQSYLLRLYDAKNEPQNRFPRNSP
jgi:hypothetical protein